MGSWFPDQEWKVGHLHLQGRFLTTGPPGKSPDIFYSAPLPNSISTTSWWSGSLISSKMVTSFLACQCLSASTPKWQEGTHSLKLNRTIAVSPGRRVPPLETRISSPTEPRVVRMGNRDSPNGPLGLMWSRAPPSTPQLSDLWTLPTGGVAVHSGLWLGHVICPRGWCPLLSGYHL